MIEQAVNIEATSVAIDPQPANDDLEQLAKEIRSRILSGDKAASKADEYYLAAGLRLIEAQKLVKGNFDAWLEKHNIGRSRAQELIRIAKGKKTVEETRNDTNKRKKLHRARQAAKKKKATTASVPERTPMKSSARKMEKLLSEFKIAVGLYVQPMDAATAQQALDLVAAIVRTKSDLQR